MTHITLMRDHSVVPSEKDRMTAWGVMTKALVGVDEVQHKRWTRVLRMLMSMEHGECYEITTRAPRNGPFHRFHMVFEQSVFKSQETFQHFEQFRDWLKIGAGHVDWLPSPHEDGGLVPIPRSIAYSEIEELPMREFHDNCMKFLRAERAALVLWPHLEQAKAHEMMHSVLSEFDRPKRGGK